ncbi:MAG: hypothetical protein WCF17_01735 [Terracidiphilus sp.]
MKFPFRTSKTLVCSFALLLPGASLLAQQPATPNHNLQLEESEQSVRGLAKQFAEILASTPLESQLGARCGANCSAVTDSHTGLTVAQELDRIEAGKLARMSRIGAEIQHSANQYVMQSVNTRDENLDRNALIEALSHILSVATDQPPSIFVLASGQSRSLLIFDNIQNGTMGGDSSYATLTAFNVDGQKLTESDSTGGDMDGYGRIDVKELPSPVQGEIWLLFSGYMTGANGPNCRMRVFAYDGKKFRTVWAPANIWGSFKTQVTRDGFVVRGDYYQSLRQRVDRYQLAADGLYLAPWEK